MVTKLVRLFAVFLIACGTATPLAPTAPPPAAPPPPPPVVVAPPATAEPVAPAPVAAVAKDEFSSLPPSLPLDVPASDPKAVKRSGKVWPFHTWDRAEAVIYNWHDYGPGQERVYDADGWNKELKYRTALDNQLATQAVSLVIKEHGELLVSKCAFPRHAVILYEGDTPVASINVCFTCHDVELWPASTKTLTDADYTRMAKSNETFLPLWHDLFVDNLHFPLWVE